MNSPLYNVVCESCGNVWSPKYKSTLWWQAHQRANKGLLDALHVDGEKCGCLDIRPKPKTQFYVFGYNDNFCDFHIDCATFVDCVKVYRKLIKDFSLTVFVNGLSDEVRSKIEFGW